jgi:hypothetical protein
VSNSFGWVAPGYLAPADWTATGVQITVSGNATVIPHTGVFIADQTTLDAYAAGAVSGATALIFLTVPPMGYTYDPGQSEPSLLYPTPALIAQYLSHANTAAGTAFTPAGTVSSTNVQDAIVEVAAESGALSNGELNLRSFYTGTWATDGTVDLATALNAAIASLPVMGSPQNDGLFGDYDTSGGGTIVIPPGKYLLGSNITLNKRVNIRAYGVTLIGTAASAGFTVPENPVAGFFAGPHAVIEGLTWDGGLVANTFFRQGATWGGGLKDVEVVRCVSHGIMVLGSQYGMYDRVSVRQCGGYGFYIGFQGDDPGTNFHTANVRCTGLVSHRNHLGALFVGGAISNQFIGCSLQASVDAGSKGVHLAGVKCESNSFFGCYFELSPFHIYVDAHHSTYTGTPLHNDFYGPQFWATPGVTQRFIYNEGIQTTLYSPKTDVVGPDTIRNGVYAMYEQSNSSGNLIVTFPYRITGSGNFATGGSKHFVDNTSPTAVEYDPFKGPVTGAMAGRVTVHERDSRVQALTNWSNHLWQGAATTDAMVSTRTAGDTNDRVHLMAGGQIAWGPGNASTDVQLERVNSEGLRITGSFSPINVNLYDLGRSFLPWRRLYLGPDGTNVPYFSAGTGTPEAVVTAPPGSVFMRKDGASGTVLYVKETGTGNTGWIAYSAGSGAGTPVWNATDQNLLGWSYDPVIPTGSSAPTSGTIQYIRVKASASGNVANLLLNVSTGGSGLTSGQNLVGLYDATGTQLAVSGDQTTAWGTNGLKTASISATAVVAGTVYYIGLLSVGTTPPSISRNILSSVVPNIGFASAPFRFNNGAASQTTLPASFTPSGTTASGNTFWVGMSV